jgi:GrpB-like predicted nucleotidyltransferase (UPF0157 family)
MLSMVAPKPVIVVAYDPNWPVWFAALARVYAGARGHVAIAVEHVGSTSVPGLAAKPIIDIDVVIPSAAALPEIQARLDAIGYHHRGDLGLPGRESFKREGEDVPRDGSGRHWPLHHLYVCARDSRELQRHLRFRDWLRTHPDDAAAYGLLKQRLAELHADDRDRYTDAKTKFIEGILAEAELRA